MSTELTGKDLEITKIGTGEVQEEEKMKDEIVTIKKSNLLIAYQNGCSDVKRTLIDLFPELKEPEWPEGYEEYGAFGWKGYTYVREEFVSYMQKRGWSHYPKGSDDPCPDGYYNFGLACLPSYIKTKNFDEE